MREFVYYSAKARTSGNFDDLMKAGRLDIAFNFIIQAFFISNQMREDVKIHMIFDGQPNPPMHLEFVYDPEMPISKKDIGGLVKRMLYKCKAEGKNEVCPGCFIEKKSLIALLKELRDEDKKIFILDSRGENIKDVDLSDAVFVVGDQEGLPKKELKRFKERISLGKKTYFASQTAIIINHELDSRE